MQKTAVMLALAAMFAAGAAQAEGFVRFRAIDIRPSAETSPDKDVDVDHKIAPEVDLSWFFTPNFAAELVLTYPQEHDVTLGSTDLGTVKHLPPTLLLQYHAAPNAKVRPYVGAGINYTFFTDTDLDAGGTKVELENGSFGPAVQLGVDVPVGDTWSFNVDAKKIWIDTDVTVGGAHFTHLDIDPLVIGIGFGRKF